MGCETSKTEEGSGYNEELLNSKLPYGKTDDDKEKRKQLWDNTLGLKDKTEVTLEELQDKMDKYLDLPKKIVTKKPIKLAYEVAIKWKKEKCPDAKGLYIKQFRAFLCNLKQYFEYWAMFMKIDTSGDKKIQPEEFKEAIPILEKWGVKITDADKTFKEIDTNAGGTISFHEFSAYAIQKALAFIEDVED